MAVFVASLLVFVLAAAGIGIGYLIRGRAPHKRCAVCSCEGEPVSQEQCQSGARLSAREFDAG